MSEQTIKLYGNKVYGEQYQTGSKKGVKSNGRYL